MLARAPWLVGCGAALLYVATLGFGAKSTDDPWLVTQNPIVQAPSWGQLGRVFTDLSPATRHALGAEYLPVRDASAMLDVALYGAWLPGHHATNLILYGLACGLFAALLVRLSGPVIALWGGLLFAAHPVHVEAVSWLSERKGLLAASLVFAALLSWLAWLRRARGGHHWPLCAAGVLLVAAIWSKAQAVAALAPMLGLALCASAAPSRARQAATADAADDAGAARPPRAWLLALAALTAAALLACYPVWRTGQQHNMLSGDHGPLSERLWLFGKLHWLWLEHAALLGPYGLSYPVEGLSRLASVGGWLGALAIAAATVYGLRRRAPLAVAGLIWLAFLAPVSQLLLPLQNTLADRYQFVPVSALAWLVGWLLSRARPRLRRAVGPLAVVTAAALTLMTQQSWRSDVALYEHAIAVDPTHSGYAARLAEAYSQAGRGDAADAALERALAAAPDDPELNQQAALIALRRGQRERAAAHFERILRAPSGDTVQAVEVRARAATSLALLLRRSQPERALELARQATRENRFSATAHVNLGAIALDRGLLDEAAAAFDAAIALRPRDPKSRYNRALVAIRRGQPQRARALLDQLLIDSPGYAPAVALRQTLTERP
ncbi:MAG: hypothetical protein Tsb0020_23470 [Haliangiales bacterium]